VNAWTGLIGTGLTAGGGIVGGYITAKVTTRHYKEGRKERELGTKQKLRSEVVSWIYSDKLLRSRSHDARPLSGKERDEHERRGTRIAGDLEATFGADLADKFFEYMNEPSDKLVAEIREELGRKIAELSLRRDLNWPRRLSAFLLVLIAMSALAFGFFIFCAWGIGLVLGHSHTQHAIAWRERKSYIPTSNATWNKPGPIPSKTVSQHQKQPIESQIPRPSPQAENVRESPSKNSSRPCRSCLSARGSRGQPLTDQLQQAVQTVHSMQSAVIEAEGQVLNISNTLIAPLISLGASLGPGIINAP
jgi:hypothetical protein